MLSASYSRQGMVTTPGRHRPYRGRQDVLRRHLRKGREPEARLTADFLRNGLEVCCSVLARRDRQYNAAFSAVAPLIRFRMKIRQIPQRLVGPIAQALV